MMSLDWRTLTWWEYQATLSAWNARHDTDPEPGQQDFTKLKRALAAHAIN